MLHDIVKRAEKPPSNSKLLVLGAGFSGQHIAASAKALGMKVICSRRQNTNETDFVFNSLLEELPSSKYFDDVTHLISCIPPSIDGKDPVLEKLGNQLKNMPLRWAGYLSTTGVYGDQKGNWVQETDTPNPQQARSQRRLSCEDQWQASELPVQILRLPGIYGPGRSAIENIIENKIKMIEKKGQVFSRIHIDDIAGAVFHLIGLAEKGHRANIINISDNLPTTNIEVLQFAGSLLGRKLPPIEPFERARQNMSPMALSFWQENRRVSNQKLCKDLGYSLIHPDYLSGIKDCFLISEAQKAKKLSSY